MAEVNITLKVNATIERIWNIISRIDNDSNYWKEIIRIKNIAYEKNVIIREVYFSNGKKHHQKVMLFPREGIHTRWTGTGTNGVKDVMLIDGGRSTIIRVQINYKLKGAVQIGASGILEDLRSETENALMLIKKEAEAAHLISS